MRAIIWGTSNSGINVITQRVMYGIGHGAQTNPGGLPAWRYISIFLGCWTVVMAVCCFFVIGTPDEVRWLSAEEKRIAAARVVTNQTGSDRQRVKEWRWDQVWITFKDPQTYFFFFAVIVNSLPNGGLTAFGNLVYVSFGFSPLDTLIKGTIPRELVSIVWFLTVGLITLKKPNLRCLLIWTILPSNVAGRTKKSVTATVLFVAYCVGNSIGAQTFRAEWAPRYIPSIIICGIFFGLECVIFLAWRLYYTVQNRRRDKKVAEMGLTSEQAAQQGLINGESDMTDWENVHFRHSM